MTRAGGRPIATAPFRESSGALGHPQELARRGREEGYLFFRGLLNGGDIARIRNVVIEHCRRHGWLAEGSNPERAVARPGLRLGAHDDPRLVKFWSGVYREPIVSEFAHQQPILRVLRAFFSAPAQLAGGGVCRVVSADTAHLTTRPHQDLNYLRDAAGLWGIWIPLVDCPLELGPLALLPRSHRLGLLPHEGPGLGDRVTGYDEATWAAENLHAGDAVLLSGLTLHRALDNTAADRLRISVDYRYVRDHRHPA